MFVIEHALLNLGKNKGRNILLGAILFAVITSAFIGMAIYNTTGIIIEDTKDAILSAESEPWQPQTREQPSGGRIMSGGGRNPEVLALRQSLRSFEKLWQVSVTFLLITLAFGALIMILLSIIAIRERKYEIGVLRAMGLKKKKVALCLWIETIAITFVCFVAGIFAGTALATPVSNALWTGDGQINIGLDAITVFQILGVSLLLASIAGAVSVGRITKYEPIKILMERD